MMRILLIANGIVDSNAGVSGGEVRLIEIARHWVRAGHDIHLMSGPGGVDLCSRLDLAVTPHVVGGVTAHGRWSFAARTVISCLRLPRSLLHLHPDVIVSANEQLYDVLPGAILKLRRPRRTRWAVVVHWLPPWRFWQRGASHWLHTLALLISERASLGLAALLADRALAVSTSTARQLRRVRFPMRRVSAVACGVDLATTRSLAGTPRALRYDAVFMKRIQAVKGIFDLIDAWALVVAAQPAAKLAIIGGGMDAAAARQRVRARGLDDNVDLLGAIFDAATKFSLVGASRMFVLPSHEENWAIVIGEAMALGVPVVAYDLPELKEVWGEAFRAVPKGNVRALASEILALLADEQDRRELTKRGLDRVSTLDWSVIAEHELAAIMESGALSSLPQD